MSERAKGKSSGIYFKVTDEEVKQQKQKKTNVRKFISVVKKYTDMTQLNVTIPREFVEQIRMVFPPTTQIFLSQPSSAMKSGTLPLTGMNPARERAPSWVNT